MGHLRKSATLGLVLLLAFSLAGAALGDPSKPVRGVGLVLEKDLVRQTVLLDGQIELHVTSQTRIVDAEGTPIELAALPTAPKKDGFREITGDATIRYEATLRQGKLAADSIAVLGYTID